MPPLKLAKALALSFTLGAVLSVASDTAITHQVQQLAVAQAQAVATKSAHAMADAGAKAARAVGAKLEEWARDGVKAVMEIPVKPIVIKVLEVK